MVYFPTRGAPVGDVSSALLLAGWTLGNQDGAFVGFLRGKEYKALRTMDIEEAFDFARKIKRADRVDIHVRMATHGRGEKWVHGWQFKLKNGGKMRAWHNGVGEARKTENDSYDAFSLIVDYMNTGMDIIEAMKTAARHIVMSGVYIMAYEDSPEAYIYSTKQYEAAYAREVGVVVSSVGDVFDTRPRVSVKHRGFLARFGDLRFFCDYEVELVAQMPKWEGYALGGCGIWKCTPRGVVKVAKLPRGRKKREKKHTYTTYTWRARDDADTDEWNATLWAYE